MLIDERQAAILLAFVAFAPMVVALAVWFATEPRGPRHLAPLIPRDRLAGPVTGPLYFGALHGTVSEIPVPTVRPFTPRDGIPVLLVDSPPGARGMAPVDLPVAFRPSCSWCSDGVRVPAGRSWCTVCGCPPRRGADS